eukprot:GFUD01042444.1.p1 GENE.GFUD01042444.1~~GFUD01042444.1.p1  ORF type:complete len:550 (+),score=95.56 GFUD01042444.1:112-1650(+)
MSLTVEENCTTPVSKRKHLVQRTGILFLTYLIYASYHISRKPISIVKNSKVFIDCEEGNSTTLGRCSSWITEINGMTKDEATEYLGLLDTTYLFSYAFFMFVSGFVAERMNLRHFLTIGMLMSGAYTFLFGFAHIANIHSIWYFICVQIACGMFQSTGWPGVVTVMANWTGKGKRGLIMGLWNSHASVGNILGSLVAGYFVNHHWGFSFMAPGIILAGMGIFVLHFLVPSPEEAESGSSVQNPYKDLDEKYCLIAKECSDLEKESQDKTREQAIGFFGALRIPGVVEFSLCLFFCKLVSYTFLYWLPNYIHSTTSVGAEEAAQLSTFFDMGGIVGAIAAGLLADKSGKPALTCSVMLTMTLPLMFLYQSLVSSLCPVSAVNGSPVNDSCFKWNVLLLILTGAFVNGPYALISTAVSAELGQHSSLQGSSKALATVTAIIDGTGSIGAAVGPFLAGWLSGTSSWSSVFYMLMGANSLALIFLARLVWNELREKKYENLNEVRLGENLSYSTFS